ncbi:MAG TPA: S8/S53 family peptidase [Thermoanaerobaculia bacterium]|nr:S8/S53 family peptidase [Thermoanaerobaculia bacterium]
MGEDIKTNSGPALEHFGLPTPTRHTAHVRRVFIRAVEQRPFLTAGSFGAFYSPIMTGKPAVRIELCTNDDIERMRDEKSVEVFEDFQFEPLLDWWRRPSSLSPMTPPVWHSKTQRDVMEHINAPKAWETSKGKGVTIAIVDSGVDETIAGFAEKSPESFCPLVDTNPWIDTLGHGSMCASIACAGETAKYAGVAPEATLLSARSTFAATDLYLIYRHLIDRKRAGAFPGGLVVSNSFGHYTCKAPTFADGSPFPEAHPFVDLVRECVKEGIVLVFAAGNAHADILCKNAPASDNPNTIWATNSIDEVISVGTVDWDETNQNEGAHANSSRGPGDWSTTKNKPDVVGPTYGDVAWGNAHEKMEWWGTSGACPQVAGLAALMLSKKRDLRPAQILHAVRASARPLAGKPANSVGAGIIDCEKALKML